VEQAGYRSRRDGTAALGFDPAHRIRTEKDRLTNEAVDGAAQSVPVLCSVKSLDLEGWPCQQFKSRNSITRRPDERLKPAVQTPGLKQIGAN
jgi:hypothetical protein